MRSRVATSPKPPLPSPAFNRVDLIVVTVGAGEARVRLHREFIDGVRVDPVGFWPSTATRFSDPRVGLPDDERYKVTYAAEILKVCFLETVVRDRRDGVGGELIIGDDEIEARMLTVLEVVSELRLLDLTGDNAVALGIPSDVLGATDQQLARQWALAIHEHPECVDGVLYPSRLNGETNVILFGRAEAKVKARSTVRLSTAWRDLLPIYQALRLRRPPRSR